MAAVKGRYKVVGGAAVVRVADGSERYLYKGAVFDAAQADAANVKHLAAIGLIVKVQERQSSGAEKPAAKAEAAAGDESKAEAAVKDAEVKSGAEKPAAKGK